MCRFEVRASMVSNLRLDSSAEVGRLKPAWIGLLSNLSNLSNLFCEPHSRARTYARLCERNYIYRLDRLDRLDRASIGAGFRRPT